MNKSSSYKHLSVILAALLTTVIIATVALVILLSTGTDEPSPDPNEDEVTVVDRTTLGTTDRIPVTTADPSSEGTTVPPVSGEDPVTTAPPETDTPPTTDDPILPPAGPVNGSAQGDALGSLELYAEWTTVAYDEETGSCTISLSFYCDSYSITLGPRYKNYLVINNDRFEFETPALQVPTDDHRTRTLLYTAEYEVQKDSLDERLPIHIEFGWHYQGRYSGEHAEWLTLTADFVI